MDRRALGGYSPKESERTGVTEHARTGRSKWVSTRQGSAPSQAHLSPITLLGHRAESVAKAGFTFSTCVHRTSAHRRHFLDILAAHTPSPASSVALLSDVRH